MFVVSSTSLHGLDSKGDGLEVDVALGRTGIAVADVCQDRVLELVQHVQVGEHGDLPFKRCTLYAYATTHGTRLYR